jgi:hypothetical protein
LTIAVSDFLIDDEDGSIFIITMSNKGFWIYQSTRKSVFDVREYNAATDYNVNLTQLLCNCIDAILNGASVANCILPSGVLLLQSQHLPVS